MLDVAIPGFADLRLGHLVLDFNGTLALEGKLLLGVEERLSRLADALVLHVVTADTFGSAHAQLATSPCQVVILPRAEQAQAKRIYVESLGAKQVVCIGNGRNDHLMLFAAALGIVVVQREGASVQALMAADVVVPDVCAALDLLAYPRRLVATLRA